VSFGDKLSSSSFPSRHVLPIVIKQMNVSVPPNVTEELYAKVETELRLVYVSSVDRTHLAPPY